MASSFTIAAARPLPNSGLSGGLETAAGLPRPLGNSKFILVLGIPIQVSARVTVRGVYVYTLWLQTSTNMHANMYLV